MTPYGSKKHRKIVQTRSAVIAQSDHGFRYALNWQTRTQGFFIRTAESNKTELGYLPFRFCRAQVHISVVTCFHNNRLIACVETNRIKTSSFEAMSNEK